MQSFPINFLALGVAAIAKSAIGTVWYTALFGKQWRALNGVPEGGSRDGMGVAIAVDLLGNFVMAFVLVHAVHYAGAKGIGEGVAVGFFNWLGFVGVVSLTSGLYEKKPLKLWLINNAYLCLSLLVMGAIVAIWT
jgi:Protein of unknown function (DUF1761)